MSCESCGEPIQAEEVFARFVYYNFGGWLNPINKSYNKWRGLRHLPDNVAERITEIYEEHQRTGILPEWCKV